jgi:transposase
VGKKSRIYSPELRAEVVQAVIEGGGNCAQVARAFGLVPETVRTWVRAAEKKQQGNTPEARDAFDRAERAAMERRIRELEAENAFLKKAAAYFAKDQG